MPKIPPTGLTYTLVAVHPIIRMVGGHCSYSKIAVGFWLQDWFGCARNNNDKMGILGMASAPPAMLAKSLREQSRSHVRKSLGMFRSPGSLRFQLCMRSASGQLLAPAQATWKLSWALRGILGMPRPTGFLPDRLACSRNSLTKLHNKYPTD